MKKRSIILGVLLVTTVLLLTGCGNKTAIENDKFKSIAENNKLTVTDATEQFKTYGTINSATIAQNPSGWQIEFYILKSNDEALSMFNYNKSIFESYKGSASKESSVATNNYSTYTLSSSGYYMYLCQVDNTLLYAKVNDTYKNEVVDIVKKLGY